MWPLAFALAASRAEPAAVAPADSVRLCLRDAVTGAPVVGARLRFPPGHTRVVADDCARIARSADTVRISRVGYRSAVASAARLGDDADPVLIVSLTPLGVARLATQTIVADGAVAPRAGALSAALQAEDARTRGALTTNAVIALLPFTATRSARGESGLSLRGARREQVIVTLDGLPLNDPATGLADVSDVPLAAVQAVAVTLGADPVNTGSGANGGVLALTSSAARLVSVRAGAFGQYGLEGAYVVTHGAGRWAASASHRGAANDFPFLNTAGEAPTREVRVNNDETRSVFTASAVYPRSQWFALASVGERGMVGAANVRAYDADRAATSRVFLRGQTGVGSTVLITGARQFALRYRDPQRPVLDAQASAWAADAEWRGSAMRGTWRIGAGADHLSATGDVSQRRARGFAAWGWQRGPADARRLALDAGVRTDVVSGGGVQPTGALGATWRAAGSSRGTSWSLLARGAQAVRVPTLYDLYFSSPQRLAVRALAPERVTLDASAGTQAVWQRDGWRSVAELSLVSRDTRDAIVWFPGNFGWSPANVGRERVRGTETRIDVSARRASLSAWHTWYRSELRSGALRIPTPYVPAQAMAVNGAWHAGAHTLSANVRHQGRRPFTAGPRNPLFELPAVTVTDVGWSQRHQFARVAALWSLTLDNVTDVQWQSVRGFPMPGRGWSAALTLTPRP